MSTLSESSQDPLDKNKHQSLKDDGKVKAEIEAVTDNISLLFRFDANKSEISQNDQIQFQILHSTSTPKQMTGIQTRPRLRQQHR